MLRPEVEVVGAQVRSRLRCRPDLVLGGSFDGPNRAVDLTFELLLNRADGDAEYALAPLEYVDHLTGSCERRRS